MQSAEDKKEEERLAEQDRTWTGGKLISLGFATLLVAIPIIVACAAQTGCSVAWVP